MGNQKSQFLPRFAKQQVNQTNKWNKTLEMISFDILAIELCIHIQLEKMIYGIHIPCNFQIWTYYCRRMKRIRLWCNPTFPFSAFISRLTYINCERKDTDRFCGWKLTIVSSLWYEIVNVLVFQNDNSDSRDYVFYKIYTICFHTCDS